MRPVFLFLLFSLTALAQNTARDGYYQDGERLRNYVFRTYTDPVRLSWLLFDSATEHYMRSPREWDRSPESYSMRVASGWGRRIVRNTAQLGFESLLHEDSRYRPSGQAAFGKRVLFALRHSVLAYRPDGSSEPMYGRFAAGLISAEIAATWHPQSTTASSLGFGVGCEAVNRAGSNLLTEFSPDLRNFGRKKWENFKARRP